MDAEPVGMTEHEIVALLSLNPTPAAAKTLETIGLVELAQVPQIARAGVQTLIVRGFAEYADDQITAIDKGQVIAAVLTTADQWYVLSAECPSIRSLIMLVQGPAGRMLIGLNPSGVHGFRPLDPAVPMGDAIRQFVAGFDSSEFAKPVSVSLNHLWFSADSQPKEASVKLSINEDNWCFEDLLSDLTGSPEEIWPKALSSLQPTP